MEYFSFSGGESGLGFGDLDNPLVGGIFASLAPDVDHVTRGLSRLPEQFKDSENFKHLIQIFLEEIQEIEETIYDILRFSSLDQAVGIHLDRIGEILGKRREGMSDEEYSRYLRVQVSLNTSQGTIPTLINLWKYLLNTDNVNYKEEFPAGVQLFSPNSVPTREMIELASQVVPVTVRLSFIAGVTGTPFCFAGNTGLGFSSIEAPSVGGQFVSIISI